MPQESFRAQGFIPWHWTERLARTFLGPGRENQSNLRYGCGMSGFEAIVAHGAGRRQPNVNQRRPAFQFVVPVAVKEVGSADGDTGPGGFDHCKGSVIVHYVIRQENLLPAAAAHIQSGEVIQRASRSDAREEPAILSVPEAMWPQSVFLLQPVARKALFGRMRWR